MQNAAATESEPLEPIIVVRSVDRSGQTFALHPLSKARLVERLSLSKVMHPRIFIAHVPHDDIQRLDREVASRVVFLLAGVDMESLDALGGVAFVDAVTDDVIEFAS